MSSPRIAWYLAIGWALAIVALSSIPAHSMPRAEAIWRMDKAIHALEYAIFTALCFRAMRLRSGLSLRWSAALSLLLCSFFGVGDELYQGTVPGRDSSAFDAAADILGACFASLACTVFYSRRVDHSQLQ